MLTRRAWFALAASPLGAAVEFPQWRGPQRDGALPGFPLPDAWPAELKRKWRVEIGAGHASPIYGGGRVFVFARQGEDETVRAIDPATGGTLWTQRYPAPYQMNAAATHHGKGPKSTPLLAGGRLYTFGISGILSAWDAQSGKALWRKEFSRQYLETSPLYGTALSPVADQGLLFAHVGGHDKGALTAFDAATGEVRWRWDGDGPGYASPLVAELAGVRQVVTPTQQFIVGVARDNGELLWKTPLVTPYVQNAVTPLPYRDMLLCSGLANGIWALRPQRAAGRITAPAVWHNKELSLYMSSPVLASDTLYGFSNRNRGMHFAMDARSGKLLWSGPGRQGENAALLIAGGQLFSLNTSGELTIARCSPGGLEIVRTYPVAETETWAHPLVLPEGILVKDLHHLTLWTV